MAYVGGLHIFKECREQSYTMQFSDNLPVEVNIDVYALLSSIRYRPEVTSHSLAYFCRVASSIRWCLESTYFSIILTCRNCNGYTCVVLAIAQAKTTFVGDLHHYISSLLNIRGTRDLTNGCNS